MLMNNRIFWLVIILSVLTIGFSSCAKDTEVADPYANWKERNEHFIDSIDPRFHLSDWFCHNSIPFVWSSTQMDWYYMWGITSTGMVCGMGKSDNLGVVIPIVEL